MPKRCVVMGCSNVIKDSISLHVFPKDPVAFRKWEKFVQLKRSHWKGSPYSCICSDHFTTEQFIENPVKIRLGFGNSKRKLHPEAVPTINHTGKRELPVGASISETPRSAYKKREIRRILQENINYGNVDHIQEPPDVQLEVEEVNLKESPQIESRSCGTEKEKVFHKSTTVKPATKTVRIQTTYKGQSKAIQCTPVSMSRGTQCDILMPPATSTPVQSDDEEDMDVDDSNDEDYLPSKASSSSIECNESGDDCSDNDPDFELANQEAICVVFQSMLMALFALCQVCGRKGAKAATTFIGTLIIVNQSCSVCGGTFRWLSQPYISSIPAGNLLLSAAILFSGALPSKVLKVLRFWGVKSYERHTYFRHQRLFLIPAILNVWKDKQADLLQAARHSDVTVGGDARCDSMGHSAKYGSYTLLDLDKNKILAMELVQSNETGGSYHMELEGLKRCLTVLENGNVKIVILVTDRHSQIQKWLRDNCGSITHYFDIWHVAKGLKKKLVALEKKKGFELIFKWRRSIINHLYWSVVSSKGNGDLGLAKWDSLANHIVNIHTGHGELFPSCYHGSTSKKHYFVAGTECYEKLTDVLQNKYLRKDVVKLSPLGQTFGVEGFHNLVNHFAPKMYHFGYAGMKSRLLLAVLHYNENSERIQATTKDGDLQYTIAYPKAKQGAYTIKKVMTECTFGYVDDLMLEVMAIAEGTHEAVKVVDAPPHLCSSFERPEKEVAVANHFSRFPNVDSNTN